MGREVCSLTGRRRIRRLLLKPWKKVEEFEIKISFFTVSYIWLTRDKMDSHRPYGLWLGPRYPE